MLPNDYAERVYAGVLGKIIGVYLGRPFEGWDNKRIEERLGYIDNYVHDKVGVRLIVTDDDISGTFTFIRALEDYGYDPQLSSKQIGQTWLNYLIEGRSVLWWGGLGNSTEHTAYIRLQQGYDAPESGSIACNGQVVAEQIGAQIFIDGWALVTPGDPARAADFARRAGSVSHDGEAVNGAAVLAAMEAQAFVEDDLNKLVDVGVGQIGKDTVIYRMISDIREWHAQKPDDWKFTFSKIQQNYGYDKYGGNCHIVPNHGLIILGFLHGDGDFSKSLGIVNTAGWDTDCNSGNLGCLMGIRNGLSGIDAGVDWRTPFGDTCYVPTADSGGGVTDAVQIADRITRAGSALNGESFELPKGKRYHFSYDGAVQGFRGDNCEVSQATTEDGEGVLEIACEPGETSYGAYTNVFVDSHETSQYFQGKGYGLMTSPALNPGQTVEMYISAPASNTEAVKTEAKIGRFDVDNANQQMTLVPNLTFAPGESKNVKFKVPGTDGFPINEVRLDITPPSSTQKLRIHSLDWSGPPNVRLSRKKGDMWHRAWVNGVDSFIPWWGEGFRIIQNEGTGLLLYGCRDWTDYKVTADIRPHLVDRVGLAARVQGMRRYYGLVATRSGQLQLVLELEGTHVLATTDFQLEFGTKYQFELSVEGNSIRGSVDGKVRIEATDTRLAEGGIALLIEGGRTATEEVAISSA